MGSVTFENEIAATELKNLYVLGAVTKQPLQFLFKFQLLWDAFGRHLFYLAFPVVLFSRRLKYFWGERFDVIRIETFKYLQLRTTLA